MNLRQLRDLVVGSVLRGWQSVGLLVTFSLSVGFSQLFEIAHPPFSAWQPYVPSELQWMQGLPFWTYLLSVAIATATVVARYLTSRRRRPILTLYRNVRRGYRSLRRPTTLPAWLFT